METSLLLRHAERVADFAASRWGRARIGGPEYTEDGLHGDWSVVVAGLCDDVEMEMTRIWVDGTEDRLDRAERAELTDEVRAARERRRYSERPA